MRLWKLTAYASFRSRDFRLLLAGNFLNTFGFQMLSVAVSWDLYQQTKSALVLGNVGFVQVAPFLAFALVAGHLADRYDRRRIMMLTQVLLAVSAVVLLASPRSVAIIYACLFLNATGRSLQGPARQAVLPSVVSADILSNAITWSSSAQEIASVGGPALAGFVLSATNEKTVYALQLALAIATLACYWQLRLAPAARIEPPARDVKSLGEGLQFVWGNKLVVSALSLDLFAVLFGGATALLPIYAVEVLHTNAHGLGWLRAAPSVGAVAMALTLAHKPIRRAGRTFLWAVAGFGAATVVFGISRSLPLSFAMLMVTGALDNISVVLRQSLVQTKTPDRVRGRVFAVNNIFISCSNQLGAVESGWTAALFGAVPSVVGGGLVTMLVVGAFASRAAALRKWTE